MDKDLIIDVNSNDVEIALLENKELMALHKEKRDSNYSVGDLYMGKIKKVIPGLNAAFVDIGYEKDAFLHYLDLGPQLQSLKKFVNMASTGKNKTIPVEKFRNEDDINKDGKMADTFSAGEQILVQIAKEPIHSKGPRVTSEISFAGRYMVILPFSDRISISQKIKDREERKRLKRLVQSIKPANFGIIVRTIAENKKVADLIKDLDELKSRWDETVKGINAKKVPIKVHGEMDRSATMIRDLLNESFNNIRINDKEYLTELKSYMKTIAPDKLNLLKLYRGKTPIFEYYGVNKQIQSSFGQKVSLASGVYLIIEHTEAMHVIDVNSGQRLKKDLNQEGTAFKVNSIAAKGIARQLRLRDMGGIVVIDFIDMRSHDNRQKLFEIMKSEMEQDHAKHTILPPTKFGLIQITRERVRPALKIETGEKCPVCQGSGKSKSSILLLDEIENNIQFLIHEQNEKHIKLKVHPYVHAYLTKGVFDYKWKWRKKFGKKIRVDSDKSYHYLEYHFFNKFNDEIKTS